MDYAGRIYRALNPLFAREPLSGAGAALHGGRFNMRGVPAIYAALDPVVALREANQVGSFQPVTLVAYEAAYASVFDSRDDVALAAYGMSADALVDRGWRDAMRREGAAPTQRFAERLIADRFDALLVRSFAPGASANAFNLVLWRWGEAAAARLVLIDDERRLA